MDFIMRKDMDLVAKVRKAGKMRNKKAQRKINNSRKCRFLTLCAEDRRSKL